MSDFEKEAKSLLRQVGKGEMKPVPNLTSANNFRHFNVLRQKKFSKFLDPRDIPAEFSLLDILEPSSPTPEPSVEGPYKYTYEKNKSWKAFLGIEPITGPQISLSGEKNQSNKSDHVFIINEVTANIWKELYKRPLLKPEPPCLKECRRRNENLYVVSKTVEVMESELHAETDVKLSVNSSFPPNPYVTGQVQISIDNEKKRSLTLPKRVVMNYKKKQLIIKKEGWEILLIGDKNQNTFQDGTKLSVLFSSRKKQTEEHKGE